MNLAITTPSSVIRETIVSEIIDQVEDSFVEEFLKSSQNKYEQKSKIIEKADDMTSQEKLDAMDSNYKCHIKEMCCILTFFTITMLSAAFVSGKLSL